VQQAVATIIVRLPLPVVINSFQMRTWNIWSPPLLNKIQSLLRSDTVV